MLASIQAGMPPPEVLSLGAAILFGAGLLRGFTGYGFSIAAVPLLSLIMPPSAAVPIALLLQAMLGVSGMSDASRQCDWRSVRLLAVAALITTPLGVAALTKLPDSVVRLCIAGILVLAIAVLSGNKAMPAELVRGGGILVFGGFAGLFNCLAGMPGPPVIAYYLGGSVPSARARGSMMVLFLMTSLAALLPLAVGGALTPNAASLSIAAFPLVWVGSWIGARLYWHSSELAYRWTGIAVLTATALVTAGKAIVALA